MNEKIETKPIALKPFKRFCMTIGELPSSYLETMSYYEMLLWFTKYLGETVIPAINNNAEAVTEVQNLFLELQDYVNNYFDDLNIQNEINNKLDDMAESGELVEIIGQYLETSAILGFDTKADLKGADNLIDGSITKTLGDLTYGDGKGQLYKIRSKTELDVVDDDNILALTNFNDLIAEKLTNDQIDDLEESVSILKNKKVIILGDSYANRENSWADRIKTICGFDNTNCNINAISGVGFCNTVDFHNFTTMLTENITINPNEVTDIIVCGGYNDLSYSTANINSALQTFITTAISTYPNAHIYLGFIGWANYKITNYDTIISGLCNARIRYMESIQFSNKITYLNNVEYIMHNPNFIDSSNFHPNADGQKALSLGIMQSWLTGTCDINSYPYNTVSTLQITNSDITSTGSDLPSFYTYIDNGHSYLFTINHWYLHFDTSKNTNLHARFEIGSIDSFVSGRSYTVSTTVSAIVKSVSSGYFNVPAVLIITGGKIYLEIQLLNRDGNGWVNEPIDYIYIQPFYISCDSMTQY